MKVTSEVRCPYCDFVQKVCIESYGLQMVYCDDEQGGCGEAFALRPTQVTVSCQVFALVSVLPSEEGTFTVIGPDSAKWQLASHHLKG